MRVYCIALLIIEKKQFEVLDYNFVKTHNTYTTAWSQEPITLLIYRSLHLIPIA